MLTKVVFVAAVIGVLLYIYINRSVQRRRNDQRERLQERREEMLEKLLEARKKKDTEESDKEL